MREDRRDRRADDRVTRRSGTRIYGNRERSEKERIRAFDEAEDMARGARDDVYDRRERDYDRRDDRDYDRRDERDYDRDRRVRDYGREERGYSRELRSRDYDSRDDRDYDRDRRSWDHDREGDRELDRAPRRMREDGRTQENRTESKKSHRDAPRRGSHTVRRESDPDRAVHQVVPYVMFWVALFAAISFVLRDLVGMGQNAGAFGNWIADFLCGLFGIAAYLVPLVLVVLSLRWRRFLEQGILTRKVLLSTSFVLLLSGIIHVLQEDAVHRPYRVITGDLYHSGAIRASGGLFGGFVGEWLGSTVHLVGTWLLAIPLLLIVAIYLFGKTPAQIWRGIAERYRQITDRHHAKNAQKYDGVEEPRRKGTPANAQSTQEADAASSKGQEAWCEPRPIEAAQGAAPYVFREDEIDEAEPYVRPVKNEKAANGVQTPAPELVDIPNDEPDAVEPPTEAESILRRTGQSSDVTATLDDILRDILHEQERAAPTPSATVPQPSAPHVSEQAPVAEKEGFTYAPFDLPVRPEPRRDRTDAPRAHIVSGAQNGEPAYQGPVPAEPEAVEESLGAQTDPAVAVQSPVRPMTVEQPTVETISAYDAPRADETAPAEPKAAAATMRFAPTQEQTKPLGGFSFASAEADEEPIRPAVQTARPLVSEEPMDGDEDDSLAFMDSEPYTAPPREEQVLTRVERVAPDPIPRPTHSTPTPVARPSVSVQTEPVKQTTPPAPVPPPAPRVHRYPPITLLDEDLNEKNQDHSEEDQNKIDILRQTLESFNIRVKDEVTCSRGPTITRYEVCPEIGVAVRSIINRIDDISLYMTETVRIAPIPGKTAIGIEVPNAERETVFMRTLLESPEFKSSQKPLEVPLGVGIGGEIQMCDLAKMPHLLVAGATGSGKSVCINTIIISLMYKTSPEDLRLILIDPKQVEFTMYTHLPHLYAPIITESPQAVGALACAVREMERRYSLMKDVEVRTVEAYNEVTKNDPDREHLPYLVIIIDEFADLKMACPNSDVENHACRLAQKARAAGIHLIIGTQRPSVDIITGKLKTNIPSRIAFAVNAQVDSRTILDSVGAELLTGRGDMLYAPMGKKPTRLQGSFVSDDEVRRVIEYIREHNDQVEYNRAFMDEVEIEVARAANAGRKADDFDFDSDEDDGGEDPKFYEAVELAIETQKVATSLLQRRLGVGYGRAAKIIDRMEALGFVSAPEGNKARKVLITAQEYAARRMSGEEGELAEDDGGFRDTY
ncbi:MAG: DNA translocase FtsK 4TM domain-containing protein [Clostridia bacterium]|nr:DNA translocase FtsK 4TM domain-containing protein [Clostridia bacterium]